MTGLLLLFIIGPMLASALLVVVNRRGIGRVLTLLVPVSTAIGAAVLVGLHRETPVLVHHVGGFAPGAAIAYASDLLAAGMILVTSVVAGIALWHMATTGELDRPFVAPLALLILGGINGALLAADLFNLFVMIEVMVLPSLALVAASGSWRRVGVGRTFVVVNLVNSVILLTGVGLVYGAAGTVNLAALAGRASEPMVAVAVGLILTALGIKAALVPAHGWLPLSYSATSAGTMGLLSALHTKVAAVALLRVLIVTTYGSGSPYLVVLTVVVLATMLVGALSSIGARRIRAVVAFQMVSGVGHILLGGVILSMAALSAGFFYLVHHVVTVGAIVLAFGAIERVYGSGRLEHLGGLMRRERWAATIVALGFLSLLGLPPTSGIWGKLGLATAAAARGGTIGVLSLAAIVVAAVLSLLALQRLWRQVFWGPPMDRYRPIGADGTHLPAERLPEGVRIPRRLLIPATVLIVVSILLFLTAGPAMDLTERAAAGLLNVGRYVQAVLP